MPLLKGGARYWRKSKMLPKGTTTESVTRTKLVGGDVEGEVFDVDVLLRGKKGRTRTLKMVEKRFKKRALLRRLGPGFVQGNFGLPRAQFRMASELVRLNKEKRLGLNIAPSIRLLKRPFRRPSLVMTKISSLKRFEDISAAQTKEFDADASRQIAALEKEGYHTAQEFPFRWSDVFMPQVDPKTGKCTAAIVDFGTIKKYRKPWRRKF